MLGVGLISALDTPTPVSAATEAATQNVSSKGKISTVADNGVVTLGNKAQQLYVDAAMMKPANRILPAGSRWQYSTKLAITDSTTGITQDYAYYVGRDLWLPATAVTLADSAKKLPSKYVVNRDQGTVIITNRSGAALYHMITDSTPIAGAQKLAVNTRWHYAHVLVANENNVVLGYLVGGNAYVKAADAQIVQQHGIFTITNAKTAGVIDDRIGKSVRNLPVGSAWRTDRVDYVWASVYYRVATHQWVLSTAGTWRASK
ncbi:hypothetical protein L248_0743 [Schleiferilactobacillus shenzhenensis LY-73]|uniref:Surface layer protein A domain-containing protein n=2 Tax=Schleiferilactobacillus shenzhenensis TaxID=1231337 RepID=U4TIP2_9LACO|nr:hypothetical protein L248_0743 [Schleiferilactobacillus shenzhenensis LY-73]